MRLPEPFCQFCRKDDGSIDYNELHAIECGVGDALSFAGFACSYASHEQDWHYYSLARGITTAFMVWAAARLLKR